MINILANQNNNKAYILSNKAIIAPLKYGCNIDDFLGDIKNGILQCPTVKTPGINFVMNATDIVASGLINRFYNNTSITSVSFPYLTTLSKQYSCRNTFMKCTNLTTIDLSALVTVSGRQACDSMFYGCTSLTSVNLSNLEVITSLAGLYGMFGLDSGNGGSLTSITFPKLKNLTANQALMNCFINRTVLQSISFPALTSTSFGNNFTNQFNNMLQGVTGCTVHFPSNIQSVIGSWTDVTNGFGGTNTVVSFDLTATE